MATTPSADRAVYGRQPDIGAANDAIDSIMANAAFDQRKTNLKRKYRKAERAYKLTSRRELARGRAYESVGKAVQGSASSVEQQNAQVEAAQRQLDNLNEQWKQQAEKNAAAWSAEFASKPKFQDLRGKERREAWNEYYQRKSRQLDIYARIRAQQAIVKSVGSSAQSAYRGYQSDAARLAAAKARYEQMSKRSKRAFDVYEAAVKRYNNFTNFVPYRPA